METDAQLRTPSLVKDVMSTDLKEEVLGNFCERVTTPLFWLLQW